ncbi:MAG TPA: phosphoribosyltransferase family protein [Nitrososphaeraceae archaeon]|jgi:predicted phosphoribosyltransferase
MATIFKNRIDAGQRLAEALSWLKLESTGEMLRQEVIVIAIPRGGIIIGDVIASELEVKLDIVVSKKIGSPSNSEYAVGAVMPDGTYILNKGYQGDLHGLTEYIQTKAHEQFKEINRRLLAYRGSIEYNNEFEGRTVVLVDDGIATGATITASAQWIKNKYRCKQLVISAPLAPAEAIPDLYKIVDKVVVLHTPEPFIAIGRFYAEFDQVTDDEVKKIMKKYGYTVGQC